MDKKDPYLALLDYRNTPLDGQGGSPAQRLLNKRTRTLLPTNPSLLQPKLVCSDVKPVLEKQKQRQEHYYNKHAKPLSQLQPGDNV